MIYHANDLVSDYIRDPEVVATVFAGNLNLHEYFSGKTYRDSIINPCAFADWGGHVLRWKIIDAINDLRNRDPVWAYTLRCAGGANFDATCKEKLTKIVAEQDPVKAGRLYLRCPDLSSREDRILLKATRDRAPGYRVDGLHRVKRG